MNIWNNHFNEEIFPNATEFKPERWLQSNSKELERYLVPFGSGSRMCIGMKYVQNSALCDQMDPNFADNLGPIACHLLSSILLLPMFSGVTI